MKYCKICNVDVNDNHKNCPLCGSYLTETDVLPYPKYQEKIEKIVSKPISKPKENVDFLRTKNNYLILLILAICVALNILLTRESVWSAYVCIGGLFLILCVMLPIANKSKVYIQITFDLPIITVLTLLFELFTNGFTSVYYSLSFILPSVFLVAIIIIDFMIIFTTRSRSTGYFSALLLTSIYAIIPQILLWCYFSYIGYFGTVTFIVFFASILNMGVVSICAHKRIREEYARKMNL